MNGTSGAGGVRRIHEAPPVDPGKTPESATREKGVVQQEPASPPEIAPHETVKPARRDKPGAARQAEATPAKFDELIHSPNRLRIMATLAAVSEIDFATLEENVEITTQLMSKQLKLLAEAGYLAMEKRPEVVGRPRTWVALTPAGRRAYAGHVNALREITRRF